MNQKHGTRKRDPETRNWKPETRNSDLAPEPTHRKPDILNQKHETTNGDDKPKGIQETNPAIGNDIYGSTSAKLCFYLGHELR